METSYTHLLTNHIPVIGLIFLTLFLAYGVIRKNAQINNFTLLCLVLLALVTIPAFLSGEEAEEAVEHIAGVNHDVIHEHEEAGEKAFWIMEGLGVLALITLLMNIKNHSRAGIMRLLTLAACVVTLVFMINTGLTGGKIRRPELINNPGGGESSHDHPEGEARDND